MAIDKVDTADIDQPVDQPVLDELRALVAAQQAELNGLRLHMDALESRLAAYDEEYARTTGPNGPGRPLRAGMVYHPPMRDPESIKRSLDVKDIFRLNGPVNFRRFMDEDDEQEKDVDAGD